MRTKTFGKVAKDSLANKRRRGANLPTANTSDVISGISKLKNVTRSLTDQNLVYQDYSDDSARDGERNFFVIWRCARPDWTFRDDSGSRIFRLRLRFRSISPQPAIDHGATSQTSRAGVAAGAGGVTRR